MAGEEKNYTPDFKVKVAEEALERSKRNLDTLAGKYDLPVSLILMWTAEYEKGGAEAFGEADIAGETREEETADREEEQEPVDLQVTDESIAGSIEFGAMVGDLDTGKIVFWSIVGFFLLNLFVIILYEMYHRDEQAARGRAASQIEYFQVNQLRNEQNMKLSEFGMVDAENGIYRIPIDSAINEIAVDSD